MPLNGIQTSVLFEISALCRLAKPGMGTISFVANSFASPAAPTRQVSNGAAHASIVARRTSVPATRLFDLNPYELESHIRELGMRGELGLMLDAVVKDDRLVALLSYWEKWFPEKIRRLIDERVRVERQELMRRADCLPLNLEATFTPEELFILFSQKGALQLTFGCSNGCPHCGLDAVPRVRDEMPSAQVENLFEKYGKNIGESQWLLYYASEPSDYDRYPEVHDLAVTHGDYYPVVTTAEVEDEKWLVFLRRNTGLQRISQSTDNGRFAELREHRRKQNIFDITIGGRQMQLFVDQGPIGNSTPRESHRRGVGVSRRKGIGERQNGIGCINGSLLTPRGIYNVVRTDVTDEFPQGQMVVPLGRISDQPIERGQSARDILRSTIIVEVRDTNKKGFTLYRKGGFFEVFFDDAWTVAYVQKRNRILMFFASAAEEERYFDALKESALENPEVRTSGEIPNDILALVRKHASRLSLNRTERSQSIIGYVRWQGTLSPTDISEIAQPIDVYVHLGEDGSSRVQCFTRQSRKKAIDEESDEDWASFERVRRLTQAAIKEGAISIKTFDDVIINRQELQHIIDQIATSDLNDLNPRGVGTNPDTGEQTVTWKQRFSVPNRRGEMMRVNLQAYVRRSDTKLKDVDVYIFAPENPREPSDAPQTIG